MLIHDTDRESRMPLPANLSQSSQLHGMVLDSLPLVFVGVFLELKEHARGTKT